MGERPREKNSSVELKRTTGTIEFCGTPFAAREKFLVHNAIEDMISERVGWKVKGPEGILDHAWPTSLDSNTKENNLTTLEKIRTLFYKDCSHHDIFLVKDGIFAGLVLTEILRKNHVFSEEEARMQSDNLLLYAGMTGKVLLTLATPRAALTRFIFPRDVEGYDIIRQSTFIFYSVFNEAARHVLDSCGYKFPSIEVFDVPGDEFRRDDIFFWNANSAFNFLGLPSIEDWSRELEKKPKKERIFRQRIAGSTLAGLTEEELRNKLASSDWSRNPQKKESVLNITRQVIGVINQYLENMGGRS